MGPIQGLQTGLENMSSTQAQKITQDVMNMVKQNMGGMREQLGLQPGAKIQSLQSKQMDWSQDQNNWENQLKSRTAEANIAQSLRAANAPYSSGGSGGSGGMTAYQMYQVLQDQQKMNNEQDNKLWGRAEQSALGDLSKGIAADPRIDQPRWEGADVKWSKDDIIDAFYQKYRQQSGGKSPADIAKSVGL